MKKLNNCKWFVLGLVVCLVSVTLVVPALAAAFTTKPAQLEYSNIKITLNGNAITPKDVSGKTVEPFVIAGTTYLPVRAVGNALGLGVDWDRDTNTVKLTGSSSSALDIYSLKGLDAYKSVKDLAYEAKICTVDLYTFLSDLNTTSTSSYDYSSMLQSDYELVSSEISDLEKNLYAVKLNIANEINENAEVAKNYYAIGTFLEYVTNTVSYAKTGNEQAHALIGNYSYNSVQNIKNNYASKALNNCDNAILGLEEQYSSRFTKVCGMVS